MEKKKVRLYEWVRIIATFLVVLGHCRYVVQGTPRGMVDYTDALQGVSPVYTLLDPVFHGFSEMAYSFHMPLFFVLSGAVLHLAPIGTFDSFLQKKSRRLLIPYFAAGLLFMFPVKLLGNFYNRYTLLLAVESFMVETENSGHLWFLPALFWCMTIFVALVKLMERAHCQSGGGYFFASLLLQVLIPYLPFDFLGMKQGALYLVWFALGYCLDGLREWLEEQNAIRLILLLFLTLVLFGFAFFLSQRVDMWPAYTTIVCGCAAVILTAQICVMTVDDLEKTKAYQILARNLFNIYLFHDPLNYLILRVFMNNGWLRYGGMCIVYFLARTLGVIVVSIALGELWRKIWTLFKQCKTEGTVRV